MKKHMLKIGGAVILALGLIVGGFYAQHAFGQAAVAYPQPAAGTTVQPTLLTNVQIATIAMPTNSPVLNINQFTNFPTGIVADTNAIITTSNPFTPNGASASNTSLTTNNLTVYGQSSNGVVYLTIANLNTNKVTLPASLVKVKVESWQ